MLVGYRPERDRLRALVTAAQTGSGGALHLLGRAGAGKSTLCEELCARTDACTVLRARGIEQEQELAFAALRDLLLPLAPHIDALPEPQAQSLRAALALAQGPSGDRLALTAAVQSLLVAAGPVLLVADDVQWLDASSLDVLAFVARRLESIPAALVLAERTDAETSHVLQGLPTVALEGLSPDDARTLVQQVDDRVEPAVVEQLWAATGGNPLALLESARNLPHDVLSGILPLPRPLPVGPRLQDHFGAQVKALDPDARSVALIAAACHGDVDTVRAALVGAGLSWSDLEAVERAGLVELQTDEIRFRHPLVRAAAYQAADPAAQRRAHDLLGRVEADPDRRAWHRAAATVGTDDAVATALVETAERARSRGGYPEAAAALAAAATVSAAPARRLTVRVDAARAWHIAGAAERAIATLEAAMVDATSVGERALVHEARGEIEMWTGRPRAARDLLRAEADAVSTTEPVLGARLRVLASMASVMLGEVVAARRLAEAAWPVLDGSPQECLAAAALGEALLLLGEYEEGERCAQRAVDALATMPLDEQALPASFLVAHTLVLTERWTEALALGDTVIDLGRRHGGPTLLPAPLALLADVHLRLGRVHEALGEASEAVEICEDVGHDTERAHALVILARVLAAQGDPTARQRAEEAIALSRRAGSASLETYARHAAGLLALGHGDDEEAIAQLEQARQLSLGHGVVNPLAVPWQPDLIEALVRVGRLEEACELHEDLERHADALGTPWLRSVTARCRGLLGTEAAEEAFLEGLDILPVERAPFDGARTLLALGELLQRGNRRQRARRHLTRAVSTFERLGAVVWAERARQQLRAAGGRTSPTGRPSLGALTPSELRVALRVAAGDTNREVAAALYLSPKTVENTLTRVYTKLGVRSRTELALLVDERD